jgi:hypothetical protein
MNPDFPIVITATPTFPEGVKKLNFSHHPVNPGAGPGQA